LTTTAETANAEAAGLDELARSWRKFACGGQDDGNGITLYSSQISITPDIE
jgi:hypothetical protein